MKAFYVFLLIAVIFGSVNAQSDAARVSGVITDQSTGESLPGVNILFQKTKGTVSNEKGAFSITADPGNLSLTFRIVGYKPVQRQLQLKPGDSIFVRVAMEQDVIVMDQVVVTASRIEQKMAELTVSMSLIKPDQVSGNHIINASELMNKAPGIEVMDGQASVRGGSGFSYGAGSRVLALLDGLPVLASDAGNIRWQFLPLDNISQIEIIKGASSVAYGSSALNGVINFRTADATSIPSTLAYAEAGVYMSPSRKAWKWWERSPAHATTGFYHLRKNGNTDIGFGANLFADEGYRKRNDDNAARISFKIKHFDKKRPGLHYGLALNGGLTRKTDFVLWENAATGALVHDSSTATRLHGTFFALDPFLVYSHPNKTRHEFKARLQRSDNQFPDGDQNNSEAITLYAEYQLRAALGKTTYLSAGLSETASVINSRFYGDHQSLNAGAFAQFEIQAMPRLNVVAGGRVEFNSLDGKNDNLVPLFRAGLNYQLKDYTYLRASFGQGYRYPSIAEKHASTTLGAVKIFPNPFVKSESGWNAETGIRQGIKLGGFSGQADLALFYSQNKNMIEFIFGIYPNPDGTFSFGFRADNLEASRVYGGELEWMLMKKTNALTHSINGSYVYMYPVQFNPMSGKNTGMMLKYRRHHTLKMQYSVRYSKLDLGMGLYVRSKLLRIDDVFLDELTREGLLPGFYDYWQNGNKANVVADVSLGYSLSEIFRLSLVVKNISNTEYMGRPGDIQPPRSISLRFSAAF